MSEIELSERLKALTARIEALEDQVAQLIRLIKGDSDDTSHGLICRVDRHDRTLYGMDDMPGVVGKMQILWRTHVWAWCTMSGAVGMIGGAMLTWFATMLAR